MEKIAHVDRRVVAPATTIALASEAPPALADGTAVIRQGREPRSRPIESLRALAALGVLVYHVMLYAEIGRHGFGSVEAHVASSGLAGLYVFFALSGYLMYRPFARRDLSAGGVVDLRRYALNRVLRLVPLYYAAVVILLLVQEHGGSAHQWGRFLLLGESYDRTTLGTVDGPLWSLVVELQFYLVVPFLAWGLRRLARGSATLTAAALSGICVVSLTFQHQVTITAPDAVWHFSFPANLGYFIPGMLLAVIEARWARIGSQIPVQARRSTAWFLFGIALLVLFGYSSLAEWVAPLAPLLIVGSAVLPLRHGIARQALSWRPLAAIGVASYSLYVWHVPLVHALVGGGALPGGYAVDCLIAMAVCVATALVSYRVIEYPALRLRRRWAPTTVEAELAKSG